MPREDWRREEGERSRRREYDDGGRRDFGQADYSRDYGYDPHTRTGYRAEEDRRARSEDYGQADYTADWGYDPERGRPYRRFSDEDRRSERERDWDRGERGSRSWVNRAGDFLAGRPRHDERRDYDEAHRYDERGEYADERLRSGERHAERRRDEDRFRAEDRRRRRGPSDRVLWAVVMERLEDERRLDLRDVDVTVQDGEVTLNGAVRRKEDKRRIEDIADVEGVRNVQNNLRVRERDRGWGLF